MALIAVVDRAERLRVVELVSDGLAVRYEASDVRWPAWLGNAARLVHSSRVDGRHAVFARDLDDPAASAIPLFQNEPGIDGTLGPGTPHYVSPSPAGDFMAVVAPAAEGMALTLARTSTGEAVLRIPGAPIFPAWSADGRYVAVHFGADLLVIEPATGQSRDVVMGDAVGFRTPAVARNGELAYIARSGRTVAVCWTTLQGSGWSPGPVIDGGAVCSFRPGSTELWLASAPVGSTGLLSRLSVTTHGSTNAEVVYRGPFSAFSWSPSGRTLVLVAPRQPGDDRCSLLAVDRTGAITAESETFLPSNDQRAFWSFFDQYQLSHHPWLSDGDDEMFVVSGRHGTDRVSPTLGSSDGNRILLWRPGRHEPLIDLCTGELGVPAPARDLRL